MFGTQPTLSNFQKETDPPKVSMPEVGFRCLGHFTDTINRLKEAANDVSMPEGKTWGVEGSV